MTAGWAETLDAILPPPGIDMTFLDDPEQVEALVERGMSRAARRAGVTFEDLVDVLEVLFGVVKS
jgi:hypothetical protein